MSKRRTSDVLTTETKTRKKELIRIEKLVDGLVKAIWRYEDGPHVDEVRLRSCKLVRVKKELQESFEELRKSGHFPAMTVSGWKWQYKPKEEDYPR